ncbi:MAG: alpha/beta hydrolase [Mangrovicoccus sp.]|nr:alpha/beta hydrolase [Mangrovicoccus sp.]
MTPLVMVHGFLGGSAQWQGQRRPLDLVAPVIAMDLPGFGQNAHLPPLRSIVSMADWVIGKLRETGVARYHLLGHSMGGMIAQEIARRDAAAIDRLVFYATGALGLLPGRFETIETSKQRAEEDGIRNTARRIAATWFRDGAAAPNYDACAAIAERASLSAFHAGLEAMRDWSGEAQLSALDHETLILWGDCDRTYPWAQINRLWSELPRARLGVIPGGAHGVHLEKEALFNAMLFDFLNRS